MATNAALNSQDWSQSRWTQSQLVATGNALIEVTATHRVQLSSANRSLSNGLPVVMSVIASELGGSAKRWLGLAFQPVGFAAQPTATFDLATGTVTQVANGTAGCVAAPGAGRLAVLAVGDAQCERYDGLGALLHFE